MNNEEPYRDQAERLKQRIEKINEKFEDQENLPPREQIHRQKKKKTKWKLKYPVIRLLVLFFILLPIIIFSVISYQDGAKKVNGVEKPVDESVGYETINLEKSTEEPETKVDSPDPLEESISENNKTEKPNDEVIQSEATSDASAANINENDTSVTENSKSEQEKEGKTETKETSKKSIVTHTVKRNENLYRLAMMYYHSPKGMKIIMKANNLHSKQINAGQVLKIPLNS